MITISYEYPGYAPPSEWEAVAVLRSGKAQFWYWYPNPNTNNYEYADFVWAGVPEEKPTQEEINNWLIEENISRARDWGGFMAGMAKEPLLLQKWQKCMTSTVRVNGLLTMLFLSGMFWKTYPVFVSLLKDFRQAIANSTTAGGDFTPEELACIKAWLSACKFDPTIIDLEPQI